MSSTHDVDKLLNEADKCKIEAKPRRPTCVQPGKKKMTKAGFEKQKKLTTETKEKPRPAVLETGDEVASSSRKVPIGGFGMPCMLIAEELNKRKSGRQTMAPSSFMRKENSPRQTVNPAMLNTNGEKKDWRKVGFTPAAAKHTPPNKGINEETKISIKKEEKKVGPINMKVVEEKKELKREKDFLTKDSLKKKSPRRSPLSSPRKSPHSAKERPITMYERNTPKRERSGALLIATKLTQTPAFANEQNSPQKSPVKLQPTLPQRNASKDNTQMGTPTIEKTSPQMTQHKTSYNKPLPSTTTDQHQSPQPLYKKTLPNPYEKDQKKPDLLGMESLQVEPLSNPLKETVQQQNDSTEVKGTTPLSTPIIPQTQKIDEKKASLVQESVSSSYSSSCGRKPSPPKYGNVSPNSFSPSPTKSTKADPFKDLVIPKAQSEKKNEDAKEKIKKPISPVLENKGEKKASSQPTSPPLKKENVLSTLPKKVASPPTKVQKATEGKVIKTPTPPQNEPKQVDFRSVLFNGGKSVESESKGQTTSAVKQINKPVKVAASPKSCVEDKKMQSGAKQTVPPKSEVKKEERKAPVLPTRGQVVPPKSEEKRNGVIKPQGSKTGVKEEKKEVGPKVTEKRAILQPPPKKTPQSNSQYKQTTFCEKTEGKATTGNPPNKTESKVVKPTLTNTTETQQFDFRSVLFNGGKGLGQ